MGSKVTGAIASSIMQFKDRLIASVVIINSRDAVRKELAKRFLDSLKEQLRSMLNEAWLIERLRENGEHPQVTLHRSNWENIRATFEIGWEANGPLSEWIINLGMSGGGHLARPAEKPSSQILAAVQRALPSGRSADEWAWT